MRTEQQFDIAIVGEGITGLSAAYHLQRLGASRICVLQSAVPGSVSARAAGLVSGGLIDNITRIAHRHGLETAAATWDWTATASDRLLSFASEQNLSVARGVRLRWISSSDELKESKQAVALFKQIGLAAELMVPADAAALGWAPQSLAWHAQTEGSQTAWVDTEQVLRILREKLTKIPRFSRAVSVQATGSGVEILTSEGTVKAEAVILANHLEISSLVPALKPALVAYADQWHEWEILGAAMKIPVGSFFSWRHGHYWGGVSGPQRLRLGGARFLRPLAGFEATSATLDPKIEAHLADAWKQVFPEYRLGQRLASEAGLDCWPADELPLIGPMFGEPRILLATGFMGQGLSMGFYAGCCMAELVQGLRPPLPRLFWPERHRNLSQDN